MLNAKPFQKRPESRRQLFEELDRPALRPLPQQRYEYAEWLQARVNIDYHVDVHRHRYSVPFELVRALVDVRVTANCVEVLHRGRRVALHARSRAAGRFTTQPEHRPRAHREHGAWPPERIKDWAAKVGPSTGRLVSDLLDNSPFPQERYGSCLGIIRLAGRHGEERMEAAALRALHYGTVSYASIKAILASGADREPLEDKADQHFTPVEHGNVRGGNYYGAHEEEPC